MRRKTHSVEQMTPAVMEHLLPLLTVADVAKILQLSRVKVYELMNKNGLPSLKISGARRIRPTALQTWIDQHQQ